jgi:hypothetical protein
MADRNLPAGKDVSVFDAAEWAVVSTGVAETDPPLVVETLTFRVPWDLIPPLEYLTTIGTGDTNALAEFVADVSGLEFDSFGDVVVRDSAPSAEFLTQVRILLREFVGEIRIEGGGDLAAELAELRLPVFGSQPRDTKPLKDLVEDGGNALMCIGMLAGTHVHALLVFAGPVGAIITLGTYAVLGGGWAINQIRQRRAEQRAADAARIVADAARAEVAAKAEAAAQAEAILAAQHERIARKQERLKARAPKLTIEPQ